MPTVNDIFSALDRLAPFETAMGFDNCGLLIGDPEAEVTSCLLALDVTHEAVARAEAVSAQLLITHHPVIFHPLKAVRKGQVVYSLTEKKLSVISAHTNLDLAAEGVNRALAEAIGLTGLEPLPNPDGLGLIGCFPEPLRVSECAALLKERLSAAKVEFTEGDRQIRKLALVSGSGGSYWEAAQAAGADAFLTGEVKHDVWISALNSCFPLLSAGHHATEAVVLEPLSRWLEKEFPMVRFEVYQEFPLAAL